MKIQIPDNEYSVLRLEREYADNCCDSAYGNCRNHFNGMVRRRILIVISSLGIWNCGKQQSAGKQRRNESFFHDLAPSVDLFLCPDCSGLQSSYRIGKFFITCYRVKSQKERGNWAPRQKVVPTYAVAGYVKQGQIKTIDSSPKIFSRVVQEKAAKTLAKPQKEFNLCLVYGSFFHRVSQANAIQTRPFTLFAAPVS